MNSSILKMSQQILLIRMNYSLNNMIADLDLDKLFKTYYLRLFEKTHTFGCVVLSGFLCLLSHFKVQHNQIIQKSKKSNIEPLKIVQFANNFGFLPQSRNKDSQTWLSWLYLIKFSIILFLSTRIQVTSCITQIKEKNIKFFFKFLNLTSLCYHHFT